MPTRSRSSRAASRCWRSTARGRARRSTTSRSAATTSVRRSAVVDWIEGRKDLNAQKIGIWGVSLGGYYAPRAAAYEKRIRPASRLSGPFEWDRIWDGLPELTRETFRVRSHSQR